MKRKRQKLTDSFQRSKNLVLNSSVQLLQAQTKSTGSPHPYGCLLCPLRPAAGSGVSGGSDGSLRHTDFPPCECLRLIGQEERHSDTWPKVGTAEALAAWWREI